MQPICLWTRPFCCHGMHLKTNKPSSTSSFKPTDALYLHRCSQSGRGMGWGGKSNILLCREKLNCRLYKKNNALVEWKNLLHTGAVNNHISSWHNLNECQTVWSQENNWARRHTLKIMHWSSCGDLSWAVMSRVCRQMAQIVCPQQCHSKCWLNAMAVSGRSRN